MISKKYTGGLFVSVICIVVILVAFKFHEDQSSLRIEEKIHVFNNVIGTQTVGPKYQFTDKSILIETAEQIQSMGSNILKFSMHPRYCTENYGLPKDDRIKSLKDLAMLEPSMKHVLDMDFKYYHIWVYGFSQYSPEPKGKKNDTTQIKFIGGYPDRYKMALYDELYDYTKYMLETFSGTGKVFYLGHWEGDWHLRWHYDRTKPVDKATLEGMIAWENIRQKAIDDAKKEVPHHDVEVYNYIEVNLVTKSMKDPNSVTLTNSVLPKVNPDYVSYSSYDATNPFKTEKELSINLKKSLSFIASTLSPKEGLPEGKRVWIGEYGNPAVKYNEEQQNTRSKWTIKAGLEWGAPFILYWEMYNNEVNSENNKHVGYWLIDDKGEKQQVWHTHRNFYDEAASFLKTYYQESGQMPSMEKFFQEAAQFESLK